MVLVKADDSVRLTLFIKVVSFIRGCGRSEHIYADPF